MTTTMNKKHYFALAVFVLTAATCFGSRPETLLTEPPKRSSINVGLLMGGGGLIGADLEFLVSSRVGLQLGGGLGSAGFGVNYHFQPHNIRSSFMSVQYLHQGFGENHYASYVGPMFVFRARRILQFGIGFGTILSKGKGWDRAWGGKDAPGNVLLLYNIGMYFPL
jgi:hypothetical protein